MTLFSTTVPSYEPDQGAQSTALMPPRAWRSTMLIVLPEMDEPGAPKMTMSSERGGQRREEAVNEERVDSLPSVASVITLPETVEPAQASEMPSAHWPGGMTVSRLLNCWPLLGGLPDGPTWLLRICMPRHERLSPSAFRVNGSKSAIATTRASEAKRTNAVKSGPAARLPDVAVLDGLTRVGAAHLEERDTRVVAHRVARAVDLDVLDRDVVAACALGPNGARLVLASDGDGRASVVGGVTCVVRSHQRLQWAQGRRWNAPWVVKTWFAAEKKMAFCSWMLAPGQSSTTVPAPP